MRSRLSFGSIRMWVVAVGLVITACSPAAPALNAPATSKPAAPAATTAPAATVAPAPTAAAAAGVATATPVSGSTAASTPAAGAPAFTVAPAPTAAGQPVRGGTLVIGSSKEMTSPHPLVGNGSIPGYIKQTMYESLAMYDLKGNLHGMLAESWSTNADASEWTFNLRKGVKFHNGQEMTSADVVWTIQYELDPQNGAYGQGILAADVASVEAVDPYTVKVTMKGPRALFMETASDSNYLSIIPANSLTPGEVQLSGNPPAGTGPFKFESWTPGDKTVVSRFDDYWDGAPYLDKIVFQLIAQETARGNALRAGDVQLAERVPIDLVNRVKSGEITDITVDPALYSGYRVLIFNQKDKWFSDPHMRQAVMLALNQQQFIDEVFPLGRAAQDAVVPGSDWEKALNLPPRVQDVAKAKDLMKGAGYNGEPLQLIAERGQGEPIVEAISRQLRDAGFNIDIQVLESGVYDDRQQHGQFDLSPAAHGVANEPGLTNQANWRCEPGELRKFNKSGYCNPAVDALLDQYLAEPDRGKRIELYSKITRQVYDDFVEYHLGFQGDRFFAYRNNVHNFTQPNDGSYMDALGGLKRTWMDAN